MLTTNAGKRLANGQAEIEDLDLRVDYQTSESILCKVDFATRQCSGVKLTADPLLDDEHFSDVQAIKFDRIGDFNYMVYAERTLRT